MIRAAGTKIQAVAGIDDSPELLIADAMNKNHETADVYFGRGPTILLKRERIKRKTFEHRRLQHAKAAA